ncbi:MAG: alpha/beta hydrolase [Rhodospirillales bacterium]|nr:alpha/beta hydrolase [Rhodospirillales bacterium]
MTKLLGHRVLGSGRKTVILLHEWLGDHNNWRPVLPYLTSGTRWVMADFRGYGWSARLKGDYTLDEAASDVLALADHLGCGKFHLVGHSMGGLVAQAVAAAKPARLSSLVLVCPVPASGFKADAARLASMRTVAKGGAKALSEAVQARTGNRLGAGFVSAKVRLARRAAQPGIKDAYLSLFTETDISGAVAGLKTPVRLICGAHDLPFYRLAAQRKRFQKWYPHLDCVEIAEAGHYPPLETPARLAGLIEDWVKG